MSGQMDPSARQIARIARLLGVEPQEVQGLDGLGEADLRTLHDQVAHAVHAASLDQARRVATLSASMPAPAAARLAERFLPPVLAARVAEQLDAERSRDLVARVGVPYLAEVAVALDPSAAAHVVRTLAPERVAAVARLLYERGEHLAAAELANAVTPEALQAALDAATPADRAVLDPLLDPAPR